MFDRLITNARVATMDPAVAGPYGLIHDGAVGMAAGRIVFAAPREALPARAEALAGEVVDAGGDLVTPALIDCHTHLVFAGTRAAEFDKRLNGATYEEIARAGGGILSTVRATRVADLDAIVAASRPRLLALKRGGVGTVEIKSGYGLDLETEMRLLQAAGRLGGEEGVRIRRTLLGLHALPPEFKQDRAGYVRLVCERMIPEAAARGLAEAVDAFCEGIGFSPEETRAVFEAARAHGLAVKLHAEQLSNLHGAALAASFGALSADHLEHLDEAGAAAMAAAGTVAVLLPGAFYVLRETRVPPVDLLRKHHVAIAVATDCNPGTSPLVSPTLAMNMACTLFRLTPEEALAGMTRHAAMALGLQTEIGMIRTGLAADLALWSVVKPAELSYWIGLPGPRALVRGGGSPSTFAP
jgi:imidazolonepropionase